MQGRWPVECQLPFIASQRHPAVKEPQPPKVIVEQLAGNGVSRNPFFTGQHLDKGQVAGAKV